MPEPLHLEWFGFNIQRRKPWRFVFTPPLVFKGDNTTIGLTDAANRIVRIVATEKRRTREEATMHELMHVIVAEGRGRRIPLASEDVSEEDMAMLLQTHALRVLQCFGFKLPPLPAGFHAFQRRCRGQQEVVDS